MDARPLIRRAAVIPGNPGKSRQNTASARQNLGGKGKPEERSAKSRPADGIAKIDSNVSACPCLSEPCERPQARQHKGKLWPHRQSRQCHPSALPPLKSSRACPCHPDFATQVLPPRRVLQHFGFVIGQAGGAGFRSPEGGIW
jgi:hypothetical protein